MALNRPSVPYIKTTDFQEFQNVNPNNPLPATDVDRELENVELTIDEIRQRLQMIQRDDGQVANRTIGVEQLKAELISGVNPPEPWEPTAIYVVGDTVVTNTSWHFCKVDHTSSATIEPDLAAGYWYTLIDLTVPINNLITLTTPENWQDIDTVATNIADVNTTADNIPDIGTVAAGITAINTTADNIPDIGTVATNIADINTNADNIADINTAAANIADINNFSDVWQGAKTNNPTNRNDGSPLQAGDLYFNTSLNVIRTWNGLSWQEGQFVPPATASIIVDTVTQLKASSIPSGQLVETKGYHSAGDGGQARYLIQTSAEFGGTPDEYGNHTLANGNVAVLQAEGTLKLNQLGFGEQDLIPSAAVESYGIPVDLQNLTYEFDDMPHQQSYVNGVIIVNGRRYYKPTYTPNMLPQGTFSFFESKQTAFKLGSKRLPIFSGWTGVSLTGSDSFIVTKTKEGIRVSNTSNSTLDKVILVANLTPKQTERIKGQGVCLKGVFSFGSGFSLNNSRVKLISSNHLPQPITALNGMYTNGNTVIADAPLANEFNIMAKIPLVVTQVALVIEVDFSAGATNNYVDIDFVGIGLNSTLNKESPLYESNSSFYLASTLKEANPKSINQGGAIYQVAQSAISVTNKIVYPVRHEIELPYTCYGYSTEGGNLRMFDETEQVNKNAFIEHIGQKGFVIRNNLDITVGNLVSFHYLAEGYL